ncbi:MAG: folylpolyglutamate synthase/dihydrofolate synthase family protein [Cyanobacteriota bacterium]|nr:folylpolyglutamate synthase/dihydrofolate synthase family protein [Cyanobacteriota bacterium]
MPSSTLTWNWPEFLDSLGRFGVQQGLERMTLLLERLGQPQQGIPVIHVAGTNGKGSVCALLSHVLWRAGYRVGRYISPHLINWRERIWVNGAWIAEPDWSQILYHLQQTLKSYDASDLCPTQFDITTAAAWLYFRQQEVNVVVLEVGLGGRLDSTNANIQTEISVITTIGRDHWQRLGNTLTLIAGEKAGICKPQVPTVSAPQVPEVQAVLETVTKELSAPLITASPAIWGSGSQQIVWQGRSYPMPLRGDVQLINGGVALTVLEQLQQQGWSISDQTISSGFAQTHWPGRLQSITIQGQSVLIDGAHNVIAAQALRHFVDSHLPGSALWLVGMLESKDYEGILQCLLRPGDHFYALPIAGHAALSTSELIPLACQIQPQLTTSQALADLAALETLLQQLAQQPVPASDKPTPILCGSLYLIGQVLETCLGMDLAN